MILYRHNNYPRNTFDEVILLLVGVPVIILAAFVKLVEILWERLSTE